MAKKSDSGNSYGIDIGDLTFEICKALILDNIPLTIQVRRPKIVSFFAYEYASAVNSPLVELIYRLPCPQDLGKSQTGMLGTGMYF